MTHRRSIFGNGLGVLPKSAVTSVILEPTLGLASGQPASDLLLGQTPLSRNVILRDGAIEPRQHLSQVTANSNPLGTPVTGGMEIVSSVGSSYPLISGTTRLAWYSAASWSALSYVSTFGPSAPPSGATTDYYDIIQIYSPQVDDNIAILACNSHHTLLAWSVGTTIYSELTGAPRARYLAALDNFVVGFNIRDVGSAESRYVQRVQWSSRGNPSNWTNTTEAGVEDLLDARGEGTRILTLADKLILFFEYEIWAGVRGQSPQVFRFFPYDRSIGTPYGWTAAVTPLGIVFLAADFMLYLLPKDGGSAQPIGSNVQRFLRENADALDKAWAVYDDTTNTYQLYYPVRSGTGLPQRAIYLNIFTGSYAEQSFTQSITRGFPAYTQSAQAGLTWSQLSSQGFTWATLPYTWQEMSASAMRVNKTMFAGTSDGTMMRFRSDVSLDDGVVVNHFWRAGGLVGGGPETTKTVQEVRVDYDTTAQVSAFTVRASKDQTFDVGQSVMLPISSGQSQVATFHYTPSRYPQVEITTDENNWRVHRLWVKMREGGR